MNERHYCRSHCGYFTGPVQWIASTDKRGRTITRRKICPACAALRLAALNGSAA